LLQRPYILPAIGFVLIFKLGDASMGFMVKPFWVDSGFTATQIAAFRPSQLSNLSRAQINKLTAAQLDAMGPGQLEAIGL